MLAQVDVPTPFVDAAWWELHGWAIATTLLIGVVLTIVSRRYVGRFRKRARAAGDDGEGRRLRRFATVAGLIGGTVVVIAWFVFILVFLDALGVAIAPLIASAGIAGVALGFGAQSLVRDTISGLFIFLEGQFDVGDVVDLTTGSATVSGTVEDLSLRSTEVRQYDGSLSTIPNGLIEITNNRTRGWGRAVVDVRVALTEDAERVRVVIEELFDEATTEPPLDGWLRQRPQVLGVTQLTDVAQVIRVAAETVPSHRVDTERLLRQRIVQRIGEKGIKGPPVVPGRANEVGL
ncbi:MAG TPA: mechanosensitive ion channel family protein [Actinomycetota bacterium]